MMLFHIGFWGPKKELERVCLQSGGEGDVSSPLGYWKLRVIPLSVATRTDGMPEGACICVDCAQRARKRGRLEVARATAKEIT